LRLFLFWSRKQRGATATKQGGEEMADLKEKEFEARATSKLPGIYLSSGCTARACWNQSRHGPGGRTGWEARVPSCCHGLSFSSKPPTAPGPVTLLVWVQLGPRLYRALDCWECLPLSSTSSHKRVVLNMLSQAMCY
jgi:hypothetical protein